METFGAVEVTGTMWCGKTWTSLAHGESVSHVGRNQVRRSVQADPAVALIGDQPHVIDEWQEVPPIWDEVRNAVDATGSRSGLYILTGSSAPQKGCVSHSGAGRIGRMRMRTMSLAEMGASTGSVSLSGLFAGTFTPCLCNSHLEELAQSICHGGWPALMGRGIDAASEYLDAYFDAILEVSIPKRGLETSLAQRVATSLARNVGTAATIRTLAGDVYPEQQFTETMAQRVSTYVNAFKELYVLEELPGWDAPIRSKTRLRTKPKRYYADSSLAAALLQLTPERLVEDGQLMGLLFESLCLHDLSVYASALPHVPREPVKYYRDSDGLEVDAIIELRDGRWAGIEVKLGENKVDEGIATLRRLRRKISLNPAARNPTPTFMAVIVGAGSAAYYLKDDEVYVIPLAVLGP